MWLLIRGRCRSWKTTCCTNSAAQKVKWLLLVNASDIWHYTIYLNNNMFSFVWSKVPWLMTTPWLAFWVWQSKLLLKLVQSSPLQQTLSWRSTWLKQNIVLLHLEAASSTSSSQRWAWSISCTRLLWLSSSKSSTCHWQGVVLSNMGLQQFLYCGSYCTYSTLNCEYWISLSHGLASRCLVSSWYVLHCI